LSCSLLPFPDIFLHRQQAELKRLEAQKEELLHPVTMRAVLTKAKQAGLSPKEVAEKLGIEI
jgi:hypothetical protein